MSIRYKLRYLVNGLRTWHWLSVSQLVPFSDDDLQRYREMLSKRHRVRRDQIHFQRIEEKQS